MRLREKENLIHMFRLENFQQSHQNMTQDMIIIVHGWHMHIMGAL